MKPGFFYLLRSDDMVHLRRGLLFLWLAWSMVGCAPAPTPPVAEKTVTPVQAARPSGPVLGIGKEAPDIEGTDIDGKPFKLSDYRGKVVFLDFWGHWCGPCRGMYPHNRNLLEVNKDKPFALLGVNVGDSPGLLQNLRKEGEITWRFWLDKDDAITKAWDIEGFPTIYLIDQRGVVRFKFLGANVKAIDKALEQLLREAGTVASSSR